MANCVDVEELAKLCDSRGLIISNEHPTRDVFERGIRLAPSSWDRYCADDPEMEKKGLIQVAADLLARSSTLYESPIYDLRVIGNEVLFKVVMDRSAFLLKAKDLAACGGGWEI